jgi:hypothetical protein
VATNNISEDGKRDEAEELKKLLDGSNFYDSDPEDSGADLKLMEDVIEM